VKFMKITISTKNISLDDALRTFVEDKIGGLEKFFKDPNNLVEIRVEIGKPSRHHRSGMVYYAEANISIGGKLLRADAKHLDLRTAIVQVKDELQIQLKKFKDKNGDLSRKTRR